jgi:hypothetical protein
MTSPASLKFESHKRLKSQESDRGLDEKENCVELMVALVACDRSSNQPVK